MTAIAMSEINISLEANSRPTSNHYQKPSHVRPPYLRFTATLQRGWRCHGHQQDKNKRERESEHITRVIVRVCKNQGWDGANCLYWCTARYIHNHSNLISVKYLTSFPGVFSSVISNFRNLSLPCRFEEGHCVCPVLQRLSDYIQEG
jgi:hypothetical protein